MSIRPSHWILVAALLWPGWARGDEPQAGRRPPTAAIGSSERIPVSRRQADEGREDATTTASAGWWFGTGGVVLALAVFGAVSVASRKYLPGQGGDAMQVIGRTSLTARHSAILLRVGDQVFVVGVGPQGAPTLLGEVADPEELKGFQTGRRAPANVAAAVARRPEPTPTVSIPKGRPGGFDQRIGDDE